MKTLIAKWLLGGIFRDIAEGKKGERLKRIYWWLSGRKRTWSAIAGLAFAGFVAWKPDLATEWAPAITLVLGLMVTIGIADADWKIAPPPVEWAAAFQKVLSCGPALSALVALLVEFLHKIPGCASCESLAPQIQAVAAATAGVTAWLAARFAIPPMSPMRRAGDIK